MSKVRDADLAAAETLIHANTGPAPKDFIGSAVGTQCQLARRAGLGESGAEDAVHSVQHEIYLALKGC